MAGTVHGAFSSIAQMLSIVSDHVSGADIVREERRKSPEAQQRVSARIEALRKGFSAIRDRHTALTGRLAASRRTHG